MSESELSGSSLHIGGSNTIPLTYVDNCADAIILAGIKHGADGQIFNVVDDDLPDQPQIPAAIQKECQVISISVRSSRDQLRALLLVGEIFKLVARAVASSIQSQEMARVLEEHEL